jgi:thiamine-monophosphate kinase
VDEFGLIARHLEPLAGEGSFGLRDDVALFRGLAVTKDVIACGVHFRPEDPLDLVARKAVRVNVSDLVAKGCRPAAMLLGLVWSEGAGEVEHATFARGLAEDLRAYGIALLGGDTTRAPKGLIVSVTMLGEPLGEGIVRRSGAQSGDAVLVSGTIGDAGLALRLGTDTALASHAEALLRAYQLPEPPLAAAVAIARHASASADVSDGLLADAGRVAAASSLRIEIEAEKVPLSAAGRAFLAAGGTVGALAAMGDDYQPVVTMPPSEVPAFLAETAGAGVSFSVIGQVTEGLGVALLDGGRDVTPEGLGYSHF